MRPPRAARRFLPDPVPDEVLARVLTAAKQTLDPAGILNPGVLVDAPTCTSV